MALSEILRTDPAKFQRALGRKSGGKMRTFNVKVAVHRIKYGKAPVAFEAYACVGSFPGTLPFPRRRGFYRRIVRKRCAAGYASTPSGAVRAALGQLVRNKWR